MTANIIRAALLTVFGTVAAILLTFAHAKADTPPGCMPWPDVRDQMKAKYGEVPTYIATNHGGGMVLVVTINPTTGTFTLWGMPSGDMACLITAGKGWEAAPASMANPPAIPEPKPVLPQLYAVPGLWGDHYLLRATLDEGWGGLTHPMS